MTQSIYRNDGAGIRPITAAETRPLRRAVLRLGRPGKSAEFPGDEAADTRHFGAYRDRKLLAVASLFRVEMPERAGVAAFQLRGMATAPEAAGTGLGSALVAASVEVARECGARLVWCNARVSASAFYRKLGFEILGDVFEIPDVGPHLRMMLTIAVSNESS